MASMQNHDDDSFIILGTSPGTSLDLKYNGEGKVNGEALDKAKLEEVVKELSVEANMAFKAHFQLGDCPSPASMMAASTIITDDKSTEDLQKQFGELLDENVILKETLKKNNESMKEQFMTIVSCQEDMIKTQSIHKEKFDETRLLIERLRQENKKLKQEVVRLSDTGQKSLETKSGPPSALEFVTSPDEDTLNKLTAQLDLVEKQRRTLILDNEKLVWQRESLEHIADANAKERDELKEKLKDVELTMSHKDVEHKKTIDDLNKVISDLYNKLQVATVNTVPANEIVSRDAFIRQLEEKVASLQTDLKTAQLKVFELENVKLDLSKHKSATSETAKMYKEQMQELSNKLKEAQTTVFQPVRLCVSPERDGTISERDSKLSSNMKLYDRALKHLAEILNSLIHGTSDSLVQSLGVVSSLQDFKLERATVDQFKASLGILKQHIEKQHSSALSNVAQVKSTMTILEGIFKDYSDVLRKSISDEKPPSSASSNVAALTAALLARGEELQAMKLETDQLKAKIEDTDLLKAQLDLYKSDFLAEREAREKMACEKENLMTDLRAANRKYQDLLAQMEEVRKTQASLNRNGRRPSGSAPAPSAPRPAAPSNTQQTNNTVFTCPKCLRFSSNVYAQLEDHFDFCLDDF